MRIMMNGWNWTGPILDHHMHLDNTGMGVEAARTFKSAGGTSLILVRKPNFNSPPKNKDDYRAAYSKTLDMAETVRKNTGINVGVILGPHPVSWERQIDEIGLDRSTELHLEAVSSALEFTQERQAIGIGEVGRPHYPISEERWNHANELLIEVLKMAKEDDSAVQLHVEENSSETYRTIDEIRRQAGLGRDKTIRHYAKANLSDKFRHGMSCTVNVGKGSICNILDTWQNGNAPWGMETDYLDDPKRPGAVLGPKTIPKRTIELCDEWRKRGKREADLDELLHKVNLDWVEKTYGWVPF